MKSPFQPQSNGRLRSLLKVEFWRMGWALSRQNSRQRRIERWLKNIRDINFKPTEIRASLIAFVAAPFILVAFLACNYCTHAGCC